MGQAGVLSRLLPARFGSAWTYAGAAAPGQMPARWLRDRFRVDRISDRTRVFGVAGAPIGHSASPAMHNAALQAAGIDAVYLPVHAATAADAHTLARHFHLEGLSVTAPIKNGWLELPGVRSADDVVTQLGVVNTVRFYDIGSEVRNFDVDACLDGLAAAGVACQGARAIVLGAGGAARAAAYGLARCGADVAVSARRGEQARALADQLGIPSVPWPPEGRCDILVNATSCGTWPAVDDSPVSLDALEPRVVYDLIYNPEHTALLRDADARGLATVGGLDMLVAQAARQFTWWTGVSPDAAVMRDAARQFVQEQKES
jgi:3-dehydroquinate dehydratase/shikimate dehydrogenase